jgi:Leucine-rich repeat (LRR) protein
MKQYLIGALVTVLVIVGAVIVWQQRPDEVNQQANTGQASNSAVLNLSNQGITKVGPEVYSKTATTDLLLSNNSIKTLPSEMGKMTKLVIFKIDHNVLEGSLIGEVRQMSQLKTLDVSYNNMTGMPAEIGQLSKLETLNYSYNKVTGLPNELAGLKNNLKTFDLTGNPLSAAQISKLKTELPNTTIIF